MKRLIFLLVIFLSAIHAGSVYTTLFTTQKGSLQLSAVDDTGTLLEQYYKPGYAMQVDLDIMVTLAADTSFTIYHSYGDTIQSLIYDTNGSHSVSLLLSSPPRFEFSGTTGTVKLQFIISYSFNSPPQIGPDFQRFYLLYAFISPFLIMLVGGTYLLKLSRPPPDQQTI